MTAAQTAMAPGEPSIAQRVVAALAEEAKARLATAELISHYGERGRARETTLSAYLRQIVPAGFDIETGFVIDTAGAQSFQQDLIIVRHDYHPLFTVGGVKFFPAEAVAAVIEVKSTLTTQTLDQALANSASVKSLDRTAAGENYVVVGGSGGPRVSAVNQDQHEHQIFSLIVAAKSTAPRDSVVDRVIRHLGSTPRRAWPNFVAVAGEYSIGYNASVRSDQTDAREVRIFEPGMASDNVEPLVDLAVELWSFLRVAPLVDVAPFRYVRGSMTGVNVTPGNGEMGA